jgi:hypothetical protein
VVAHAFNPSTWEAETDRLGFKASLAYRVSSRTASVTQRNCIMKKKQTKMNLINTIKKLKNTGEWWLKPLIPALGRQGWEDF